MDIKIKYFDEEMKTNHQIKKVSKGDWIDLRVANAYVTKNDEDFIKAAIKERQTDIWINGEIYYEAEQVIVMRLGVAMELPVRYKAKVFPRSSTFPTYGLILTNSVGCIDYKYCGDTDEWLAVFYATRAGHISKFDRVCQFEIVKQMPELNIVTVNTLGNENREGFGSTGNK